MSVSKKFKIADNSIDIGKLTARITDQLLPLGTILDWYPVNAPALSAPNWGVPTGFAICDGTAWNLIDNTMGADGTKLTTGNIPNLVGKVTMGAQASLALSTAAGHTSSTGAQTNPGINGVAGANAGPNADHRHDLPNIPNHDHDMAHYHFTPLNAKTNSFPDHISGTPNDDIGYIIKTNLAATTAAIASDSFTAGSKNSTGQGGAVTNQKSSYSGAYYPDNRPASVGVLKIMKVKFS